MCLTNVDCALGRLVWNLWSLEWMLRNVLYLLKRPPHTELSHPEALFAAKIGQRFPANALTSFASLGQLIDAYNETAKDKPVDRSLVALRDTIAHGRVLAKDEAWQHFVLTKFTRPDVNGVGVETRYELTFDWMNEQIVRVGDALDSVKARYHELKGSS